MLGISLRSELVELELGGSGPSGTGMYEDLRPGARAELVRGTGEEPVAVGGSTNSSSSSIAVVRSALPRIEGESCGETRGRGGTARCMGTGTGPVGEHLGDFGFLASAAR